MSRVFEHPNMSGFKCPVCQCDDDKPVVLVPIIGTEEGGNVKAIQVHHTCILEHLMYDKVFGMMYLFTR